MMQSDGNLVLRAPGNVPTWASNTAGRTGANLHMQSDGNLVARAPGNVPVWASGTNGNPGTVLQVQDDGNAVLYNTGHVAISLPDAVPVSPPTPAPARKTELLPGEILGSG